VTPGLSAFTEMKIVEFVLSVDTDTVDNTEEFCDVFEGLGFFEGEHHIVIDQYYKA
jgi:hypothetical protein